MPLQAEFRITGCQILGGMSELHPEQDFDVEFTVENVGDTGKSVDYAVKANGNEVNTASSHVNQGETKTIRSGSPHNRLEDVGISNETATISVEISPTFNGDSIVGDGQTTCGQLEVLPARPITLTNAELTSNSEPGSDGSSEVRYTVENPSHQYTTIQVQPTVDGSVVGSVVDEQGIREIDDSRSDPEPETVTSTIGFSHDFSPGDHELGVRITNVLGGEGGVETREMTAGTVTAGDDGGGGGPCQQDISDAQESGSGRDCPSQTAEMQCPDDSSVTYQAVDGCEISYLSDQGWTRVDGNGGGNGDLVEVTNCSIVPERVGVGRSVTLRATVQNNDSSARTVTVTWSVGSQTASSQQEVGAGESAELTAGMQVQSRGEKDVTTDVTAS